MTNPFLIVQLRPEDEAADNEFEAMLRYGGLQRDEVVRARIEHTGLPAIDLERFSAVIVGGSPFDMSTPETEKPAIQKRIERDFAALFARLSERDYPFLGACSGNSLLGRFCGARISRRFGEPVGGTDIELTEAGKRDPLLAGLPDRFRVLVGHKEACDATPPGTVLLASSAACPVQMFRLGRNIYATQFHPEADAAGFSVRIKVYRNHGYFPPETADELIAAVEHEDTPFAREILARFVRRYRR